MHNGNLYIVATPIGNLQDITLRAIEVLKSVDYIACEDTRKTGILLRELGISRKSMLISYYEQTEDARIPNILNLLINGQDVALVSDSGTPVISDPGFPLVREVLKQGIKVISIPGPSALVSALVSSGQPPDKFLFLGFLPKKEGNKIKLLNQVKEANKNLEATVILYEAPHRILKTLSSLETVFGSELKITVARELTKVHEEVVNSDLKSLIENYESKTPKGEFVLLFNPKNSA
jgi:16S rRNA (cytidine1402-2'-O)-methyltransferase